MPKTHKSSSSSSSRVGILILFSRGPLSKCRDALRQDDCRRPRLTEQLPAITITTPRTSTTEPHEKDSQQLHQLQEELTEWKEKAKRAQRLIREFQKQVTPKPGAVAVPVAVPVAVTITDTARYHMKFCGQSHAIDIDVLHIWGGQSAL